MGTTELVRAAIGGDAEAFGELYEQYASELFRYACFIIGSTEPAKDAVQDALCSAFMQIGLLRSEDAFKPWLFKILSASCKKYINELSRQRKQTDIDELSGMAAISQEYGLSAELSAALKKLSADERETVILSVLHGYKSREIADILGLSPGSVRSKLSRSLDKLKIFLDEEAEL